MHNITDINKDIFMEKFDKNKLWRTIPEIFKKLPTPGILLVSGKSNEKKNIMTIGWLEIGYVWKGPVITVLVRPSRHSFNLLQEYDEFTVNVLSDKYNKEIAFCGTKSGSFCDKFKETNLQAVNSTEVFAPSIKEADIVIECKTIFKSDIDPQNLNDIILARYYSSADYHQRITASIININIKNNIN